MPARRPPAARSRVKSGPPTRPEHRLGPPYDRLLTLGDEDSPESYDAIAAELKRGDARAAAAKLLTITLDATYYNYDPDGHDPRTWTRTHALCVLERMGEAAHPAIEPLLPLLEEEDDELREESLFFYAEMGEAAMPMLTRALQDSEESPFLRSGAADSLTEIAERHKELRPQIVELLEKSLANPEQDEEVAGFLVCNLLDLGSQESLPIIRQAFEESRVEESIVAMADVEEHFGLRPSSRMQNLFAPNVQDDLPPDLDPDPEPVQEPFVAGPKVGRNDPCPCGSGKKHKKCCGQ